MTTQRHTVIEQGANALCHQWHTLCNSRVLRVSTGGSPPSLMLRSIRERLQRKRVGGAGTSLIAAGAEMCCVEAAMVAKSCSSPLRRGDAVVHRVVRGPTVHCTMNRGIIGRIF